MKNVLYTMLNKIMNYKYIYILLIAISLESCLSKELHLDLPFDGQQLVIEGLITPSQVVQLSVLKTSAALSRIEVDDFFVPNATVLLYEEEELVEQLTHTSEGIYRSSQQFRPEVGKTYRVEVTAPNFPNASTPNIIIPDTVPEFTWNFIDSVQGDFFDGILQLTFEDIANTNNNYSLIIEGVTATGLHPYISYISEDFTVLNPSCKLQDAAEINFIDACFQNSTVSLPLLTSIEVYENGGSVTLEQIRIVLRNTSESYFLYKEYLNLTLNADEPFVEEPLTYTNIEGGFGVWGAYQERVIIVDL